MSKNFKGYMGDQIGKLGTAVGRKWKRKMVYSAYQGKVRNPNTEHQQLVRARFTLLVELARQMRSALVKGFNYMGETRQCTEQNCFVSTNYSKVTGASPEAVSIDMSQVEVSKGTVAEVTLSPTLDTSTPGAVTVTVADANLDDDYASRNDEIYAFVFCPDAGRGVLSVPVARTVGASITVSCPTSWSGLEVHVYVLVIGGGSSTDGKASPTMYAGHAEIG